MNHWKRLTYCLVVVIERNQSATQMLWKARLQLELSQVQSVPDPLLAPSSSSEIFRNKEERKNYTTRKYIYKKCIIYYLKEGIEHNKSRIRVLDSFEYLEALEVQNPRQKQDYQQKISPLPCKLYGNRKSSTSKSFIPLNHNYITRQTN